MKRKRLLIPAAVLLILVVLYLVFAYAQIPFIANLRRIYIETAMGTLNHQWLATSLLPETAVNEVMSQQEQARNRQVGLRSAWKKDVSAQLPPVTDRDSFYCVFHELIPAITDQWLSAHPQFRDTVWQELVIPPGQADGLTTKYGEKVIAVDVPNRILLVEAKTANSQGVLAIAKDPSLLSVCPSPGIGSYGDTIGNIASQNGGILAITCGAFHGANEDMPGGDLAGYAMCSGTEYGSEHLPSGNKRVELHSNDLLYITDTTDPVGSDCTDAAEFRPALLIDGEILVKEGWAGLQPRVCLGQSDRYEIMMLVMEGRILSDGILGASVLECAQILKQHGSMQAINLDGGNSGMMWYNGEYLTRCCDPDHPEGRPVPTAVVYGSAN